MPFSSVKEFEKSFPGVKELPPEQKQKALDIFNAMMKDKNMDEGMAIATAMKKAKGMDDMKKLEETFFNYISEVHLAEDNQTSTVEVLRVGTIQDRGLKITKQMLEEFVQNFKDNVYGTEVQINLEHKRGSEAAGWIKDLFIDGSKLMASVEWTELGVEKITKKLFKFVSAELAGLFPHHESGKLFKNVFVGCALTNAPAMKAQKPLVLSENLEKLANNLSMFKKYLQSLKERAFVSKEDKALMKTMLEELPAEEQEAAKADVTEVDKKPEAPEKTEAEKQAEADAAKKAEDEKLTDKGKITSLEEKLAAETAAREKLQEEMRVSSLKESLSKTMVLSESVETGFVEKDLSEVVAFVASLNEAQVAQFNNLMTKVRNVKLGAIGENNQQDLSEKTKMQEAQAEAEKMAKETGRAVHECLSEVYKAKGLAK